MLKNLLKKIFSLFSLELKTIIKLYPINFCHSNYKENLFEKYFSISSSESLNVSRERFASLHQCIDYIYQNKIKGDFVECGVFRGGSSMMIAFLMKRYEKYNNKKKLWLYDTFEGMTHPSRFDTNILNQDANIILNNTKKLNNKKDIWAYSTIETVIKNLNKTKLKENRYKLIKGPVEETLKKNKPKSISLLRLDTDFYSSTKAELENLIYLVNKNGVIIVDDYGHWKGCRKAVDEFFKKKKNFFYHRIDYTGIIILKLK